jgi:hypothetical protein
MNFAAFGDLAKALRDPDALQSRGEADGRGHGHKMDNRSRKRANAHIEFA